MGFWVSVLKSIGLAQNIQPIAHCNGLTGYQVRMGSIGLYQVESVYFKVIDSAALENITWKRNIYNFADKHNPTDAARDRKINIYTWHGRIFKEVMILLILQEYIIVNVTNLNSLSVRNERERDAAAKYYFARGQYKNSLTRVVQYTEGFQTIG